MVVPAIPQWLVGDIRFNSRTTSHFYVNYTRVCEQVARWELSLSTYVGVGVARVTRTPTGILIEGVAGES